LGETEKKLSFEVSSLKTELVLRQAELELERQDHQTVEQALRTQVVEAGKRRDDALAAMQEASEKAKSLKRECEGTPSSFLFLCFFISIILF
jgi:hypothetical protein